VTVAGKRVRMDDARAVWAALAIAMAGAVALILWMGRDTTLYADDVEYFAHMLRTGRTPEIVDFSARYVLAPFNGHLQAVGKLIYEAWLQIFGPNYFVLRVFEALMWAGCVGLFFVLARTLVGPGISLAASVLLLFLGAGWEVMLWAFDLHTLIALLCGLGALVVLRRDGWRADSIACVLLVVAVASIELGLAFVVGVGVGILLRDDRWRRIWIVAVPIALYLIWSAWAHQFGQEPLDWLAVVRAIISIPTSLSATVGSLFGLIDPGGSGQANKVGSIFAARLVAVLVAVLVVRRIGRGRVSDEAWVLMATLLTFWAFVALGVRPADQSRYVFPSSVLLLLVGAGLLAGVRFSPGRVAIAWVFVVLAMPTNLIKLADGRDNQIVDARATKSEYTALDLAGTRADPEYAPFQDLGVTKLSDFPFNGLTSSQYLPAAARFGSLGYSLDELAGEPQRTRLGTDASLVGAFDLRLSRGSRSAAEGPCRRLSGSRESPAALPISTGATLVRATGSESALIGLTRFSDEDLGVPIGRAHAHWSILEIPADAGTDAYPWTLHAAGTITACQAATQEDAGG
jgi:hypothetical protein